MARLPSDTASAETDTDILGTDAPLFEEIGGLATEVTL
jgi:hypothetical protein